MAKTGTGAGAGWYQPKTTKVTMEKWGREDLYVEYRDPTSLPLKDAEKVQRRFTEVFGERPDTDALADPGKLDEILQFAIELMTGWHMEDPLTGEEMPKPTSPDEFRALPIDVLELVISGTGTTEVPKESESSPTPLPKESVETPQDGSAK